MTILGLQKREFMTEEMDLRYYYNKKTKKTVILTRQFLYQRTSTKTGMMIEVCVAC
jgi:hypothetical protein